MCGILGFHSTNLISDKRFENALEKMWSRGPDNISTRKSPCHRHLVGHLRLSILDLSSDGNQPFFDDTGNVLVYNGEIYNYKELYDRYKCANYDVSLKSDTATLFNLLSRFGAKIIPELDGMFAFSFFNEQTNNILLARDRFGVKPLYYYNNDQTLVYGSEIKSIIPLLDQEVTINLAALANHTAFIWNPSSKHVVDKIQKVSPGTYINIHSSGSLEVTRWHKRKFCNRGQRKRISNIDNTEYLLRNAVHRQMQSDASVASFLSGGVDSSAIAAIASEIKSNLQCYTIEADGFDAEGFEEDIIYAEKIATRYDLQLTKVKVSADHFVRELRKMIYHIEEPLADPAAINVALIARQARQDGHKVLLSGTGGDDIFSGYRRHQAIQYDTVIGLMPKWTRDVAKKFSEAPQFEG